MAGQNQHSSHLGKIAAYTEILAKDPTSTIFVSLSEAYRKMGMLDEARKVAEAGLEHHTDFTPAHIVLARILCQQSDYQGSNHHFERALELEPTSLAALVGCARLNILLGQEDRARDLLLEARKQSPADPVINKLLISLPDEPKPVEAETQHVPEAEAEPSAVSAAEELPAKTALASATLAELYLKQGLEEQALDMYRQLSAQNPNNLELRRKIRDLEELLTAPPPQEETEIPEPTEEPTAFIEPETAMAESESAIAAETAAEPMPAEEVSSEQLAVADQGLSDESPDQRPQRHEAVLQRLNQWLDSIQMRRGNV